ncbi:iron ABC transporter permease [bacterium]|nr:iron ABC transporter permease [bacterium]
MRTSLGWLLLGILLAALVILSCFLGPAGFSLELLVFRLPRVILTVFAGGILAFVGASLQGLLENPLVDPYIIGSSSGAGVGVALSLLFGWTSVFGRPLFAFAGAIGALALVYAIASVRGRATRLSLILSGVALSFVCSSLVMVLMVLSRSELSQIIYLLMGSTNIIFTPQELWTFIVSASLSVAGAAWILGRWRSLDILSSNVEAAETLGVNTRRLTSEVFIISALLVGVVVAFAGAVSFVGLIVPHIVRFLFGPRHLRVLPASVLVGASLLLASDLALRLFSMATNVYLPLSVVTTIIGVPFFLFIMKRRLSV